MVADVNDDATNGVSGLPPAPRVAVLGLGNVLMGDDAFGPYVVRLLQAGWEFPPDVSVQDVGTPGLDLAPFVAEVQALVLVDIVRGDQPPGTLRAHRRDEILKHAPPPRVSPHDPGVKETLITLQLAGQAPSEVFLIGAVPHDTEMRVGLSPPVQAAVPAVIEKVLEELERLGSPAVRRPTPLAPDLWWEAVP